MVSFTGTQECTSDLACHQFIKQIQQIHMKKAGSPDIMFHFVVGGDGKVYEGLGWNVSASIRTEDEEDLLWIGVIGSHSRPATLRTVGVARQLALCARRRV